MRPSTEGFEGRLQGSIEDVAGAGMGYGLTGVVNIPMGDSFAVRASGFYRTTGGYIDSIGNNPIPALQDPSVNIVDGTLVEGDINDSEVVGGRVSALFTPSENFSLDLSVHYQDINSRQPGRLRSGSGYAAGRGAAGASRRATTTSRPTSSTGSTVRRSTGISAASRCSP